MKNIIVRTNGEPFATRHSAEQQLSKRFLRDTHEVVEHGGGFGLVPIKSETITLQPGDYVSTVGMSEADYHAVAEAFMEAGAEKGEYPAPEYAEDNLGDEWACGWMDNEDAFWHGIDKCFEGRHLTIAQVLGATSTTAPATAFDTLLTAARKRNEARAAFEEAEGAFQLAMDAANAELGEGFEIRERDETIERAVREWAARIPNRWLVYGESEPHPCEDTTDPANWRVGDVVECVSGESIGLTKGKTYKILGRDFDGDPVIRYDDGDVDGQFSRLFRFHHRPT